MTAEKSRKIILYLPMTFAELVIWMRSSVLNSPAANQVNRRSMRIFVHIRQILADTTEVRLEIEKIKNELSNQGKNMEIVFAYLDELSHKINFQNPVNNGKRIGFKPVN